jgi:deoxyribonuclease IV
MAIKILTAGNVVPDGLQSLQKVRESGLDGQELEFVRQVYMGNDLAKKTGELAKRLGLALSIHASYFINLSSVEPKKIADSRDRILLACERAYHLGAHNVVFHAGFYGKLSPEETYAQIKKEVQAMLDALKKNQWHDVVLCPETTGKKSQFGSLKELLRLREETGCGICVDFSHLLARDGKIDYHETIKSLPASFHSHFSGIEYTDKGERRHIPVDEEEFRKLARELILAKKDTTLVCEAPDPFKDSLRMKKIVESL